MQRLVALALALVVLAFGAATTPASAGGSATVTVNGVTQTLSQTGFVFSFEGVGNQNLHLAPGQSADFDLTYSISVHSDRLPVPFDERATGCSSIFLMVCEPEYHGFEYAQATLFPFFVDGRIQPPSFQYQITGIPAFSVTLGPPRDSFAYTLTQSGTVHLHVFNDPSYVITLD